MIENLVDFALNVGAGAVVLLCLFEGTRRLGAYGVHRKAVLLFALSAGVCALCGGFAYQKYADLKVSLSASQRKPSAVQAAATLSRVASPEKRELLSQASARHKFKEFGTLGPYIDRDGQTRTFAPTQEDLAAREVVVAYYTRTENTARASLAETLLWLIAGVVAVFLGLAMSLDKPPRPEVQDDALETSPDRSDIALTR